MIITMPDANFDWSLGSPFPDLPAGTPVSFTAETATERDIIESHLRKFSFGNKFKQIISWVPFGVTAEPSHAVQSYTVAANDNVDLTTPQNGKPARLIIHHNGEKLFDEEVSSFTSEWKEIKTNG